MCMRMAAKVRFHSSLDEMREHSHSLDPSFFPALGAEYETTIQHVVQTRRSNGSVNIPARIKKKKNRKLRD